MSNQPSSVADVKSAAKVPVKIILPTAKYPWMMDVLSELDYPCSNCTAAAGHQVYRKVSESFLDPISGPGIYSTRLGVYCPDCKTQCKDYGYIQNGILDLLTVPKDFKGLKRAEDPKAGGIFGDEDLSKPLVQAAAPAQPETEQLAPAMVLPPKPVVDPGPGNVLVYSPERGWHVLRVAATVGDEKLDRGRPKPKPKTKNPSSNARGKDKRLKALKGKVLQQ